MSYRRILIGEVRAGDDVLTGAGDLFRVTEVEVARDSVCLHGHDFVGSDFNPLLGSFTDVHAATVIRLGKANEPR
jgi:hypothetical protein